MKKIVKNILTASAIITSTTLIATEGHAANAQQTIPFNTLNLSSIIKPNSTSSFIHTPPESAGPLQDLTISTAFNSSSVSNVVLNYHTELDNEWKQIEMVQVNNKYEAVLTPDLRQGQNITYYMTATVNGDQEYSDEFTVYENQPEYKPEKVPSLLITEVMARTTKIGDTEAYEYIEVYNNSTSTINLKDYNIQYRYPSKGAKGDLIWPVQQKGDLNLEPGKAMVFWITNDGNRQLSIQDFNAHYQTALEEGKQVVRIEGSGLTNGSYRGVAIATNTRTDISTAFYNQDEKNLDVGLNQAIVYAYPIDGKKRMRIISSKETAGTPGIVEGFQVPTQSVTLAQSYYPPVIYDNTEAENFSTEEDAHLAFELRADTDVKTATFYYKRNGDADYRPLNMKKGTDGLYHAIIPRADLIGHSLFKYYVVASDGDKQTKTSPRAIEILGNEKISGLQMNVENSTLLTKTVNIKAMHSKTPTASKMTIDGTDVTSKMTYELPAGAYFAFETNQTANYYKNAVTIGKTVLKTFDDRYDDFTAITVPVESKYFTKGDNRTFQVRAGSKDSAFDTSGANLNDILVRNMRLVLNDGTTLYPKNYMDPTKIIEIGDAGNTPTFIEPIFEIPDNAYNAKTYQLDTTTLKDGEHTIVSKNGKSKKTAKVIVDNTAPTINSSIANKETYKGAFTINAEIIDANATDGATATLDGEPIELPYDTSSAALSAGEHTIVFQATDRLGNSASKTVKFTTKEEMPYEPLLVGPTINSTTENTAPLLNVKVSDPTNDNVDVAFNRGYSYEATNNNVTVVENNAEKEPPDELASLGEVEVYDKEAVAATDGNYVTTKSIEKFPYHRFKLNLDANVTAEDEIEVNWEGKSLVGRKVTMYIWNYDRAKWEAKIWKIAENEKNFKLNTVVKGTQYTRYNEVQVMVQDEIASTNQFDYSFVWMSDTQYYSKSYPAIYKRMTEWVAQQANPLNIKYVFHTGDLVDTYDSAKQWKVADAAMQTLDTAGVPYGVLAGNHDVMSVTHKESDYTNYNKYFGESRFVNKNYYGGSYKNNRGHYDLISEKGTSYLMMYMGWEIGEEEVAWMNSVLKKYPERKAILNFHEYLGTDGKRTDTGNYLFDKVVKPNKNVLAVLSGHLSDAEILISSIDDDGDGRTDRKVHQLLMDYQSGAEGGQGFLRLLKVNPISNKINVETYSPYLNKNNYYDPEDYPEKDQFEMAIDIAPREKMVATDSIHFNVYTNEPINKLYDVADGETVQARWRGLQSNTNYSWYVKVTDEFGGEKRSPVWNFTTGTGSDTTDYAKNITVKTADGQVIASQKAESGYEIPLPKQENAVLEGLYNDAAFTTKVSRNEKFSEDKTVYAKFVTAPPQPTLQVTKITYNSAKLSWEASDGATKYEVYRALKKDGEYEKVATTTATAITDKKLATGTTYYYKIRALTEINGIVLKSELSSAFAVKPRPATSTLAALTKKGLTVSGSYKKVTGAEKYVVYRSTNDGLFKKIKTLDTKTVKFTDKTVKKGNTYTYKVRSYRTENGKKYYSSYSNIRSIRIH